MPLLTVSSLRKRFNLEAGFFARFGRFVNAVNDVSFVIGRDETYGLVGESGCGKTTTARLLVRMYDADSGKIFFHWENNRENNRENNKENHRENNTVDVGALKGNNLRQYRQKVRYVFQDPARSLNPRMSIYETLVSGVKWTPEGKTGGHNNKNHLREIAAAALEEVGLPAADLDRRPAEFSGGQRQRISIARGLLPQPELLICDEVVSALDVSIQGQILNLLLDIREKRVRENRTMSFLFIAHDLKVACYFCDRIGVMYAGELMEEAPAADLWNSRRHPYTQMLFAAAMASTIQVEETAAAPKIPAVQSELPLCAFAPRCPMASRRCYSEAPVMREAAPNHFIRCHGNTL